VDVQLGQQVTDVDNIDTQPSISIFPNPVETNLNFSIEHFSQNELTIKLFDLLGRPVFNQTFSNNGQKLNETIDVSILPTGTYVFEVTSGKINLYEKVILK